MFDFQIIAIIKKAKVHNISVKWYKGEWNMFDKGKPQDAEKIKEV